jgi:hypothetical protein
MTSATSGATSNVRRVFVHNFEGGFEMTGTIASDADLDGVVAFTDEDDGEVHYLNGWLWEFADEPDDKTGA